MAGRYIPNFNSNGSNSSDCHRLGHSYRGIFSSWFQWQPPDCHSQVAVVPRGPESHSQRPGLELCPPGPRKGSLHYIAFCLLHWTPTDTAKEYVVGWLQQDFSHVCSHAVLSQAYQGPKQDITTPTSFTHWIVSPELPPCPLSAAHLSQVNTPSSALASSLSVAWDIYLSWTLQEHSPSFQSHQLCQPSSQPDKLRDPEPEVPLMVHLPHPWAGLRSETHPPPLPSSPFASPGPGVGKTGEQLALIQTCSITPTERGEDGNGSLPMAAPIHKASTRSIMKIRFWLELKQLARHSAVVPENQPFSDYWNLNHKLQHYRKLKMPRELVANNDDSSFPGLQLLGHLLLQRHVCVVMALPTKSAHPM